MKRFLLRAGFLLGLLVAWHLIAASGVWSQVLLPSPAKVATWIQGSASDGSLLDAVLVTMRRLALGYGLGTVVGLPIGFLSAHFRAVDDTLGLLARGIQSLPSVCWVPLALLSFGLSESAMMFVVVMGTLGSIAVASADGMRSVPPIYTRVARTMGSKGLYTWFGVVLPASFPFVLSGMKQGWAFAWRSLMAAEIFVPIATGVGLGRLLNDGRELQAMDQVIGVMFVIVVIGIAIDRLLFAPAERALHRRWGTGRAP